VILRIFDGLGGKNNVTIKRFVSFLMAKLFFFSLLLLTKYRNSKLPVAKIYKTNALEDDLESVMFKKDGEGGEIAATVSLRAFEVATFRLQLE